MDRISDDLGSLKFGFALLQDDNIKLFSHFKELMWVNQKLLAQLQDVQTKLKLKAETLEDIEGRVHPCGGPGWRQVVNFDMRKSSETCPTEWSTNTFPERSCSRTNAAEETCDTQVTFEVTGGPYSKVCGRAKGFQFGIGAAFLRSEPGQSQTMIEEAYVHGLSLTHGSDSRQHIWTFAVGLSEANPTARTVCPCDASVTRPVPIYVGNDYFCESGNKNEVVRGETRIFYNDALWDGKNCFGDSECCAFQCPPYFFKDLGSPTTNNIDARLCYGYDSVQSNIALQLLEIFVQ